MTSTNTQLLGFQGSESKKYSQLVNYTALGEDLPICFTRNSINVGFVSVDPQTRKKYKALRWESLYLSLDKLPFLRLLHLVGQKTRRLWNLLWKNQMDKLL